MSSVRNLHQMFSIAQWYYSITQMLLFVTKETESASRQRRE